MCHAVQNRLGPRLFETYTITNTHLFAECLYDRERVVGDADSRVLRPETIQKFDSGQRRGSKVVKGAQVEIRLVRTRDANVMDNH